MTAATDIVRYASYSPAPSAERRGCSVAWRSAVMLMATAETVFRSGRNDETPNIQFYRTRKGAPDEKFVRIYCLAATRSGARLRTILLRRRASLAAPAASRR